MKKFHSFLLCVLMMFTFVSNRKIKAEDNFYYVYQYGQDDKEQFDSYSLANSYYEAHKNEYPNLILSLSNKVIRMEYGIVIFNDEEITYYSEIRDKKDYLDGHYFLDAAYLNSNDKEVTFKLSGEIGSISIDQVKLIPYSIGKDNFSLYETKNNTLFHNIKTSNLDYYQYFIDLGGMPEELNDDSKYYSYDGHFFYDSFYLMIDDYKNNSHDNAVNKNAYYNYYQYLPSHCLSNIDVKELENYFYNTLNINGYINKYSDLDLDGSNDLVNKSMLYKAIDDFVYSQNMYGVNALNSLASSIVETSYGKSLYAYVHNSLFNNLVFDSKQESDESRYLCSSYSIYNHDKYFMNKLYSDYQNNNYAGTHFGNKLSGITIEASLDPYFGEKCANVYMNIDNNLGDKDLNAYAYGIASGQVSFYFDEELSDKAYSVNIIELPLIIVEEKDNAYLVQADYSFDEDYGYDFKENQLYISKDDISILINKDNIHNYDFDNLDLPIGEKDSEYIYELQIDDRIYDFNEIRNSDLTKLENSLYGYHINNSDLDISVSGLANALRYPSINLVFGDTYYVNVNKAKVSTDFEQMIKAYGYEIVEPLKINFKLNYFNQDLLEPVIFSCKVNHQDYKAYSVYHIKNNGDIVKMETNWSNNYVYFLVEEKGEYIILSRDINNNFDLTDAYENINAYNSSPDNHKFIRQVLAFLVLMTLDLISFIVYFMEKHKEENLWKGYRKSLQQVVFVQEEKQKN